MGKVLKLQSIQNKLNNFKTSSLLLLSWIFIGFLTRFDFNQMWGCVIDFGELFDYNNIGFFILSFALILIARFLKNKKTSNILLIIELVIWLIKYTFYKGGYATGLSGNNPLGIIVLYDTIAIFFRLLNLRNNNNFRLFKSSWVLAIIITIISLKIFFFAMPHDLQWETARIEKKIEKNEKLLIGDWSGYVKYDSIWVDTIKSFRLDTIKDNNANLFELEADRILTDSTHRYYLKEMKKTISEFANIAISNDIMIKTAKTKCKMDFIHWNWGSLLLNDSTEYGHFEILKINNDSLDIIMTVGYNKDYNYKLKRK